MTNFIIAEALFDEYINLPDPTEYDSSPNRLNHPWKLLYNRRLLDAAKLLNINTITDAGIFLNKFSLSFFYFSLTLIDLYAFLLSETPEEIAKLDITAGVRGKYFLLNNIFLILSVLIIFSEANFFSWNEMPLEIQENGGNKRYSKVVAIDLTKLVEKYKGIHSFVVYVDSVAYTLSLGKLFDKGEAEWYATSLERGRVLAEETSSWNLFMEGRDFLTGCVVTPSGRIPWDCIYVRPKT